MKDLSAYKNIITYMDNLHSDIGKLVILIERLMEESGYVSLQSAGNKASWGLSNHYAYSDRWRMTNISRFYMPEDLEKSEHALFYFILLNSETDFSFPVILCGRVTHPPLTEKEIYSSEVWNVGYFSGLAVLRSKPIAIDQERGWFVTHRAYKTDTIKLYGYFLNIFDLVDRQHVIDNIVLPLTTADSDLDEFLTIQKYSFAGSEATTL